VQRVKLLSAAKKAPADAPPATIVLVEPDPYLAFLIRLHVPETRVIEAGPEMPAHEILAAHPDLVIVDVDAASQALSGLLAGTERPRVLGVVDGIRAARTSVPTDVDAILTRPFVPAELNRAVRTALGMPVRSDDAEGMQPILSRARGLLGPARLAAVAISAVIEVSSSPVSRTRGIILACAFVYATIRWVLGRPSIVAEGADVAVAIALVAATGGLSTTYWPVAVVACIGIGLMRGPNVGLLCGFAIVAGSLPSLVQNLNDGTFDTRSAVSWFVLFPLLGTTGGFASRVWRVPADEGLSVLVEANRVLSSLYRLARTLPGGLEIGSVADAAMQEIRDAMRSSAGLMMVAEAGEFAVVGSYGLRAPGEVMVRDRSRGLGAAINQGRPIIKREELTEATAQALGDHECWLAAVMRRNGIPTGLLMAACPNHAQHDTNRLLLQRLADEASVAVENARLFSRVREISIDEERRRLARELHDGVAQALTHLRLELDFMARHGSSFPDQARKELARLERVVQRASGDVRSMILGLRSSVSAEGLLGALRSYLSDLRGLGGPDIIFEARGEVRLRPDIESEIFRIAQEGVSNALRHSGARNVRVSLTGGNTQVRLVVQDDGVGMTGRTSRESGGGVGMGAMRERAELIGATLEVSQSDGGGTTLTLEYQIKENP
jgi:signal transduction histidine kinase